MNRLYTIAFKRILASVGTQEISPLNVGELAEANKIKSVGSYIYHRMAREEVRNFIKTPCPVEK